MFSLPLGRGFQRSRFDAVTAFLFCAVEGGIDALNKGLSGIHCRIEFADAGADSDLYFMRIVAQGVAFHLFSYLFRNNEGSLNPGLGQENSKFLTAVTGNDIVYTGMLLK